MELQKAFSFDAVTAGKVAKSLAIVAGGAIATYLLNQGMIWVGNGGIEDPALASILTAFFAWAINTVKEYIKGV